MMFNFLNLLSIFINEIRKFDMIIGGMTKEQLNTHKKLLKQKSFKKHSEINPLHH